MKFLSHQGLMLGLLTGGTGYIAGEWWTILFGAVIFVASLIVCHFYFEAGVRKQEEIAVAYAVLLQAGLFYGFCDLYLFYIETPEEEKWRCWFWLMALLLLMSRIMLTLFPGDQRTEKERISQELIDSLNEWNKNRNG